MSFDSIQASVLPQRRKQEVLNFPSIEKAKRRVPTGTWIEFISEEFASMVYRDVPVADVPLAVQTFCPADEGEHFTAAFAGDNGCLFPTS